MECVLNVYDEESSGMSSKVSRDRDSYSTAIWGESQRGDTDPVDLVTLGSPNGSL